jgi:hypothetical protein
MSDSVSAPPPPGLSKEEKDLIAKQGLTLDQFNNLLSDSRIQSTETQGILKNLSGLYKTVNVPGSDTTKTVNTIDTGRIDAQIAKLNKQLEGTPQRDQGNIKNAINSLTAMRGNADLAAKGGYVTTTTTGSKTEDSTKQILDEDALASLKSRIQQNQDYDSNIRNAAGKYLDSFVSQNLSPQQTALQGKQVDIANLQADRLTSALKGELPVSPALTQRKQQDFNTLKEQLARSGHVITGDTPDTAQGFSTPAIQSLESFNKTYGLLEDQERRGELDAGSAENIAQYGLLSSDATNKLNQALTLSNFSTNPGGSQLSLLTGANSAGPTNLLPYYSSLASGYGGALQPYQNQSAMQYQTGLQNSANAAAGNAAIYQLLGSGIGAYAGYAALASSRTFKKNIKKISEKEEDRHLSLLSKSAIYTYDYKQEDDADRPHHLGVVTEEAPEEIVTPDGKHLDVVNYFGLLTSAVRSLHREVLSLRRKVAYA